MSNRNGIFLLYKPTDATLNAATLFKKYIQDDKRLKKAILAEYKDSPNVESYYLDSLKSSILLCLIDDEWFYEMKCHTIWNAFWKQQLSEDEQIIFPALIEDVVSNNFDDKKKVIYENAKAMGFYTPFAEGKEVNEREELFAQMKLSLAPDTTSATTNVHRVYEIGGEFMEFFEKYNKEYINTSQTQKVRFNELDTIISKLKNEFVIAYQSPAIKRVSQTDDVVCVLYTGGTAGLIYDPNDVESLDLIQANLTQLIEKLPRLKREKFEIDFYSFELALDSSNITSGHWLAMAAVIDILKDKYQGFVIIHGSNTMAYSAAALSFLLNGVDKPIIFTGSELALTEINNDAEHNIQRSIEVAAHKSRNERGVAEVCLLFGKRLIRGNRATKQIALDTTEGFYSPNYPELASVSNDKIYIDSVHARLVDVNYIRKKSTIRLNKHMSPTIQVAIYDVYPDMDMSMFSHMCSKPEVGAVIIRTYGTGGFPSENKEFIKCLDELRAKHTIVVNITQCPRGNIEFRLFETNATLFNNGVISGGDMVTEAAYCKLKHLFSKFENFADGNQEKDKLRTDVIKHYMMVSMRGELSRSMFIVPVPLDITSVKERIKLSEKGGKSEIVKYMTIDNVTKALSLKSSWFKNPAKAHQVEIDEYIEDDSFAELSADSYISSAVLRLGGVRIVREIVTGLQLQQSGSGDRDKNKEKLEAQPHLVVTLSAGEHDKRSPEDIIKGTAAHRRKNIFEEDSEIDINIDILNQARAVMPLLKEFTVSITSETHEIEVSSINILLSVIKSGMDR